MPQAVNQPTKINYSMNNHPKSCRHTETLLTTPSLIFSSLIADMQRARETIEMEYYIFASDRTGALFADILRRKSRQGLRVRLIVDGYGSLSMSRAQRKALQRDGVELHTHALWCHSRYHRKMAIIDSRIAHIGGINIADRYVVGNTLGRWHDVQLRITGSAVRRLSQLFDYDYMVSEGVECEVPSAYSRDGMRIVWSEARGGYAMQELFSEMVASAKRSIVITTPYFMPPRLLLGRLAEAIERGVGVTILLSQRCDVWLLDNVIRSRVAEATRRGIDVRICREGFVHSKLMVVDGERIVVGSANLDARSMYHNREIMVVAEGREVVASAESYIESLLKVATPPTERDRRGYIPELLTRCFEGLL